MDGTSLLCEKVKKNEGKVYYKCPRKIDDCADVLEELWNTQICCCVQRIMGVEIILFSKSKHQSSRSSHKVKVFC